MPIPVDLKQQSEYRWLFSYTVKNIQTSKAGKGIISYRVRLNTQRMAFSITGRLHGSDNQIRGEGRCKLVS